MKLILCGKSDAVFRAMERAFFDFPEVDVVHGDILDVKADAVVSPANSFGWMDGGIDLVYRNAFGEAVEHAAIAKIAQLPRCELHVGGALYVCVAHERIKGVVVAPTMRVPGVVADTDNAYRAFRAALLVARECGVRTLAAPGMATGVGRMHPVQAAEQMCRAWREVSEGQRSVLGATVIDAPAITVAGNRGHFVIDPGHSHGVHRHTV